MNRKIKKIERKCIICKEKYIPIWAYSDIQHGVKHGDDVEVQYLSCGKCPKCAEECFSEIYKPYSSNEITECEHCGDDLPDFYNFYGEPFTSDMYGEVGKYFNFYDLIK